MNTLFKVEIDTFEEIKVNGQIVFESKITNILFSKLSFYVISPFIHAEFFLLKILG